MESAQKEKSLNDRQSVSKPIKKICFEMLKMKQLEQEAKERYGELQAKLKAYFVKSGKTSLQFSENGMRYDVSDANPKQIVWDVDKLRGQVSKDIAKQIIETKYGISDWDGFAGFLKSHNIKPSDIVPFLTIERKVKQKKLDELSELGEITDEDVDGCFTVKEINGYVRLNEKVEEVDEETE